MLKKYCIEGNKLIETEDKSAPIFVYVGPDETERRHLVDSHLIDEHTLASALDPDEQSRLEWEPNHVAMIFKKPKNYSAEDELLFKAATVGLFLFKDRLIIVCSEDTILFDGKPLAKVCSLNELILKLVFRSIYHFMEHLKIINNIAEEIEDKINKAMENRYLINLFALQKSLVYYQNAITSNGVLLAKLKNNVVKLGFNQEELELLDDILIENDQCYRQAEVYSNILASLMDARASIVSNNLNILMKTLNIITITIMMPTLIVSIFSMNVPLPGGLNSMGHAFWVVMGIAGVSMAAFLLFWRTKKW